MIFKSQAMLKVEMMVPEDQVVAITEALAASQVFHLIRSDEAIQSDNQETGRWQAEVNTYTRLEQRLHDVMVKLEVSPDDPPDDPESSYVGTEEAERQVDDLEREMTELVEALEDARARRDRLREQLEGVRPLAGLDVTFQALRDVVYTFAMFGTMPLDNVSRMETSLEHIPSVLITLGEQGRMATVGLFGPQQDAAILSRAARSAFLNPIQLPASFDGTPDEAIARLEDAVAEAECEVNRYREKIHDLHEVHIQDVRQLFWRIRLSRHLDEIIIGYEFIHYNYLIAGWVPAQVLDDLQACLEAASDQVLVEVSRPVFEDPAQVPFQYRNPRFLKAFEGLVDNYGHPRYGELDPTFLVALTFPLVFGLMFGDVGHGLVLLGLGVLIVYRVVPALNALAGVGGVLVACGVTSMGFGLLYGSVFGVEELLPALWVRPLENIMTVLLVAVGFGTVTLSIGMIANIANAWVHKRWAAALFEHSGIAGLVFYWSLVGLIAGFFAPSIPVPTGVLGPVALISGLLIGLSGLLEHWIAGPSDLADVNVSMVLMESFFGLFETIIGFLSNTLSYVRMGAFAVAHGALSLVVFIIAGIVNPGEGLLYWIVVALGNLFVLGFEGMIVAIQTLRLEYYEFFDKFFDAGGQHYQPLSLIPASSED